MSPATPMPSLTSLLSNDETDFLLSLSDSELEGWLEECSSAEAERTLIQLQTHKRPKERAEASLHEFVKQAWPIVEPDCPFIDGWHIRAICEHLEAVADGRIKRLLINVPPGCSKSLLASVFWACWVWGPRNWPQSRWLFASYGQELPLDGERIRDKARQAYNREYESVFRSRIPKDLETALRRMTDRAVRHKRVLEVAKMPGHERPAALAKDSAEEQRISKLRRQFMDEVNEHKILGFVNFVNTSETAQSLKTLDTKLQQLQTKIDKFEANLFPRLTRDQLDDARTFARVAMRADEGRLEDLEKTRDEMTTASLLKELEARSTPELGAALRRWNNPDATFKRLHEILELPSREQKVARQKDAEEDRKLEKIWAVIDEEVTSMFGPLAVQIDLDAANDIRKKCGWQKEKCDRHHARSKKLEEYWKATFGR